MELREDCGAVIQPARCSPDFGHYRAWILQQRGKTHIWGRSGQIRAVGCCSLSDLSNSFPVGRRSLGGGGGGVGESRVD